MLKHYLKRRQEEEGFTLIELMVVVLIIGILIAIALPTFLGARGKAQDKGAASDLRNGFSAAKTYYTDGGTYVGFDVTAAQAVEPNLSWAAAGDPLATGTVTINNVAAGTIDLVRKSDTGTYFCAADTGAAGAGVHKGTDFASVNTAAKCVALPKA